MGSPVTEGCLMTLQIHLILRPKWFVVITVIKTAIERGKSKSYLTRYNLNTLNDHKKALILVCC